MIKYKRCKTKAESILRKTANHKKYRNSIKGKTTKSNYAKVYKETTAYKKYQRNYRLKNTYGITLIQYEEMFNKQNGCCAICNVSEEKLTIRLHIDHNHKTGKVRGLLCKKCNSAIGLFDDNLDLLNKAINYINEYK